MIKIVFMNNIFLRINFTAILAVLNFFILTATAYSSPDNSTNRNSEKKNTYSASLDNTKLQSYQNADRKACLIDALKLEELSVKRKYIVVDGEGQRQAHSLRNVFVIPLSSIKLKIFLKHDTLVLLPHGAALHEYLAECGRLRKNGFKKVFVLKDGLNALEAEQPSKQSILQNRMVDARSLFLERNDRHWIIIYAKTTNISMLRQYLPPNTLYVKKRQLHTSLSKIKNSDLPLGILAVDATGNNTEQFKKLVQDLLRSDVYYLDGGVNGFEQFIRTQKLITGKHEFVLQKPKSCGQ